MFRTPKTPVILVLMLVLGHAPIPWMHDHLGADDRQLAYHLKLFHPRDNENELPRGWHLHLLPFEIVAGGDIPDRAPLLFTENGSLRRVLAALGGGRSPGTPHDAILVSRWLQRLPGSARSTCPAKMSGPCEICTLLSVLLL